MSGPPQTAWERAAAAQSAYYEALDAERVAFAARAAEGGQAAWDAATQRREAAGEAWARARAEAEAEADP